MPVYGATDVIAVVLMAAVALPWSHWGWRVLVYIFKKTTKWAFAYTAAVVVVALLQYSTTYTKIKAVGDAALNEVFFMTSKRIMSKVLTAAFGNGGAAAGTTSYINTEL